MLTHAGRISHKAAEEHAHAEFARFEAERRRLEATQPSSDFDRVVEYMKKLRQPTRPKPGKSPPADEPAKKAPKRKKRTDD